MGASRFTASFSTSLRTRILLLTLVALLAVAVPAYFSFSWIVNSTVVTLGTLFAEKQILFDRYRGLGALLQEVKLAETLARSPAVRDWALDEGDPGKMARGLAELEHYRQAFDDKSYFFVVGASGNYYFNDAANTHAGDQLRYRLSRDNPRDGWYYQTAALGEGCHLNVDHDDVLTVTKVWINCVIRDRERVLGVLGSGIDLSFFIREVVDIPQPGVTAMFVDRSGAVQAHRDPRLVDFHSLTKQIEERKTIFALLDRPEDQQVLAGLMRDVTSGEVLVKSAFMQIGGRQMLVGVGYLDRLGWYNVTVMDIDQIIDSRLFMPIGLLLVAIMLFGTLIVGFMFKRNVLDRLALVERRFSAITTGDFTPFQPDRSKDEIGRLSRAFAAMATAIGNNRQVLEQMVQERTEELETLAYRDQLTQIANRRGFIDGFAQVQQRAHAAGSTVGLLLLDIDRFKEINDGHGHLAGDQVVAETARRLNGMLQAGDICGRWGGDEFVVLIHDISPKGLHGMAEAARKAVCTQPIQLADGNAIGITVSVGACLVEPGDSIDVAADMADAALYRAKTEGRDRVVIFDAERAARGPLQVARG